MLDLIKILFKSTASLKKFLKKVGFFQIFLLTMQFVGATITTELSKELKFKKLKGETKMTYKIEMYVSKDFIKATELALKDAKKFGDPEEIEELTNSLVTLKKWAKEKFVEVNNLNEYFELIDKVADVSSNEYASFGKTIEIGE